MRRHFWLGVWLLLALVACTQAAEPPTISGSGALEGRTVIVASELGGHIVALTVNEGDAVAAGQVLVQLDAAEARAQVAQAEAAVAAAEANLAQLRAGPRPQAIRAAEAQVARAQAEAEGAAQALLYARQTITQPLTLDLQISQARTALALAEQEVERAEANLAAERLGYHIHVELAEAANDTTRQLWDLRIQAQQAALAAAEAQREAAQANLNALWAIRAEPLEAQTELHAAQATYTATLAALAIAEAELAQLAQGARPEELRMAEAQLHQAEAGLTLARIQQTMLTLTAPISGVVVGRSYQVGEIAPQGRPILTLVDLETLYLTLYIPAAQLGQVRMGQPVAVTVDAYPGETFTGAVTRIASEAEFTPSAVQTADDRARLVFAIQVQLPNPDRRLHPGMPALGTLLP